MATVNGYDTDLAIAESCITSMSKMLQVHIQVEAIPLCHHSNKIGLIVASLDCRPGTMSDCFDEVVIFVEV